MGRRGKISLTLAPPRRCRHAHREATTTGARNQNNVRGAGRRSRSCCAWGEGQLLRQRRLLKGFRNPKFLGCSSKSG
ncbi:hypothetical protein V6Z12_D11G391200 [Gossypium hirsutum]